MCANLGKFTSRNGTENKAVGERGMVDADNFHDVSANVRTLKISAELKCVDRSGGRQGCEFVKSSWLDLNITATVCET